MAEIWQLLTQSPQDFKSGGIWEVIVDIHGAIMAIGLGLLVLAFVMILTVYGRFFKLFLFAAIAPISLSTFAGEPTSSTGRSFVKSYAAVCLEGAIIVLGCIIFSLFASVPPAMDASASPLAQM